MSSDEVWGELERTVGLAVEELQRMRARAAEAAGRCAELEGLLTNFRVGEEDPMAMKTRLTRLEEENRDLKERIEHGREGVDRLLARIRFLEGQQP